jgi:hypothetical protein
LEIQEQLILGQPGDDFTPTKYYWFCEYCHILWCCESSHSLISVCS